MKSMTKSKTILVISILVVLLLSACQINMKTEIDKNGAGVYIQEIGFQGDEASMSGLSVGDDDFCTAQMDTLPPNTTTKQETRNEDETWCVYETKFESLDDLHEIYGMTDTQINTLKLEDNALTYDITLDLQSGGDMPMGADMFWQVTMPGKIVDHNADEVDGNTLTWKLRGGEINNIQAESELGGFNFDFGEDDTMIYVIGGVLGVAFCCVLPIIIAVVVFLLIRRNKMNQGNTTTPPENNQEA